MKIEKKLFMFLGIFLFVMINLVLISSIEYPQCCKIVANNGGYCLPVTQTQCAQGSEFAPTSCDSTDYCAKGTCINMNTGECTEQSPKYVCVELNGGVWKNEEMYNLPECQRGCCVIGQEAKFVTKVKCKQIASEYGVSYNFRGDITDSNECLSLSLSEELGACVIKTEYETTCAMISGKNCNQDNSESLVGKLNNYVSGSDVEIKFHKDMLCTADSLDTNCVKTKKTICYKDKVYYEDSCGNRLNVFNSGLYTKPASHDYWTYIQKPSEVCNSVTSSSLNTAGKVCGNCDYYSSTKCRSPQSGDVHPQNQDNDEHVCGDLSCEYKNEHYENTESWCAETNGTFPHIQINEIGNYLISKDLMFNPEKYNLPGSRYVKLECYEGEVLEVPCKDQREQICKEVVHSGIGGPKTTAFCDINNYKTCFINKTTKDECNAVDDCYWLSGDKVGGDVDEGQTYNQGERFEDNDNRAQKQGSCVPLFAPGTLFWEETGQAYCMGLTDTRNVIYEINLFQNRKDFGEDSDETGEKWSYNGENSKYKRQSRCQTNCFAIPTYGGEGNRDYEDDIKALWDNNEMSASWSADPPISRRKGHFCYKEKGGEIVPEDGEVCPLGVEDCNNDPPDCYQHREDKKGFPKPEFYTHLTWLNFTRVRARAMGDCGITNNFIGEIGSYDSEKITTIIAKVKQDQQTVKHSNITKGILYDGIDLAGLGTPAFEGKIKEGSENSI